MWVDSQKVNIYIAQKVESFSLGHKKKIHLWIKILSL